MLSKLIEKLKKVLFPRPLHIPTDPFPQKWTEDDKKALLTFLQSPVGRRFLAYMQAELGGVTHACLDSKDDRDYKCGYAAGFRGSLAVIMLLSSTHMLADSMIETPEEDLDVSFFGE